MDIDGPYDAGMPWGSGVNPAMQRKPTLPKG